MTLPEILNAVAAVALLFAAVRGLVLFHCRVSLLSRLAIAAVGFFAWAGIAAGDLIELRGAAQGFLLSMGTLAGVMLWKMRRLSPECSVTREPRSQVGISMEEMGGSCRR